MCDKSAFATISQAIFFCGAILGGLVFGWLADSKGRIPALVGTNLVGLVGGIGTAFCNSFWSFCLCRFVVGMAFDNCFTMMYILGKLPIANNEELPLVKCEYVNVVIEQCSARKRKLSSFTCFPIDSRHRSPVNAQFSCCQNVTAHCLHSN